MSEHIPPDRKTTSKFYPSLLSLGVWGTFSMAPVTNYHTLSDLKLDKCIVLQFWQKCKMTCRAEIKVSSGLCSFWRLQVRIYFFAFSGS